MIPDFSSLGTPEVDSLAGYRPMSPAEYTWPSRVAATGYGVLKCLNSPLRTITPPGVTRHLELHYPRPARRGRPASVVPPARARLARVTPVLSGTTGPTGPNCCPVRAVRNVALLDHAIAKESTAAPGSTGPVTASYVATTPSRAVRIPELNQLVQRVLVGRLLAVHKGSVRRTRVSGKMSRNST